MMSPHSTSYSGIADSIFTPPTDSLLHTVSTLCALILLLISAAATFHVHGYWILCLDARQFQWLQAPLLTIVVMLQPASDQCSITAAHQKKLRNQDALARQALLTFLASEELTKVYQLKSSHEIWQHLADEYSTVSDPKRAPASTAFYSLQKNTHVNARPRQRIYPPTARSQPSRSPLTSTSHSYSPSANPGRHFIGPRLHTISPQLFALTLPLPMSVILWYSRPSNSIDIQRVNTTADLTTVPNSNICFFCKRKGHIIRDCFKKKWRDTQGMGEEVAIGEKITPDWVPRSEPCWNFNA
jgi:hypothetical protein